MFAPSLSNDSDGIASSASDYPFVRMSNSSMSFVGTFVASPRCLSGNRTPLPSRRPRMCAEHDDSSSFSAPAPIPESLQDAANQAIEAVRASLSAGLRRTIVEVDTAGDDKTYTLVKKSLPFVRMMSPAFGDAAPVTIVMPDAGGAALAKRDWASDASDIQQVKFDNLHGFDPSQPESKDEKKSHSRPKPPMGILIVAPRSSEVDILESAVDKIGDIPAVIINPDLIDMGVTGLSHTARRLRERITDNFETVYYLRVFGWGVLLRAYPGSWGMWIEDESSPSGFRCVRSFQHRPTADELDKALTDSGVQKNDGPMGGLGRKVSRFLKTYMQG